MPADTILHNAKVATNAVPRFVESLATTGGKIAAVGTEQEVFQLRGPKTTK
jgi:predicted amidohydrolase YtcJ